MSVFVIDHNTESTEYISQIVSSLGLTPKSIKSLASLVTSLQQETPRLIIAEALLPGYDDFIVLQYIHDQDQKELKDIPVVVTTSRSKREDILKARQLGAKGFLIKPSDADKNHSQKRGRCWWTPTTTTENLPEQHQYRAS